VKLPESFDALRERPFRLLWSARATSAIGDAMTPVALTFAVLGATGSAGDLGLVLAAYTLSHAVFILVGGVWGDRLARNRVMLSCDLIRAAALGTLAVLVIAGEPRLWQFVGLAFVVGTAESFFGPASTGLVPQTISPGRLQQANALNGLTESGSWIFGPTLSGVIVATAGAGWVFAIDAITFVASAAFLSRLRVPAAALETEPRAFLSELAHGWREVRSRRWLWTSLIAFGIGNLAWGAPQVLGPIVAEQELGGAAAWGLILTGGGIGGLLGGLVVLRWRASRPLLVSHLLIVLLAFYVLGLAVPLPTLVLSAGFLVSMGSIVVANTLWETVLQSQVPNETLSRVSSYDWAISLVFMPLGFVIWGPLSDWIGLDQTLLLAAATIVVTKVAVSLVPEVRGMRRPEPADIAAQLAPDRVAS
jgi:MFS family permease